jgi:hypothetical protein
LHAGWKCQSLRLRYPCLAEACDLVALPMDVCGPEFEAGEFLAADAGRPAVDAVFVCLDDNDLSLRSALTIHRRLRHVSDRVIPVVVRVAERGGLSSLLNPKRTGKQVFAGLDAFGLLDETCKPDVIRGAHETLARTMSGFHPSQRQAVGQTLNGQKLMEAWLALDDGVRRSYLALADGIGASLDRAGYALESLTDWKMASYQLSPEDVNLLAQQEYERFAAVRPAGDALHPGAAAGLAVAAWEALPAHEQDDYRAYARALPAILARAGYQMAHLAPGGR